MAKRFTATEIWDEDWFLEMPIEYKLFWFYMKDSCDHAGLFKVNIKSYCLLNEVKLTSSKALEYFNHGKQRIRVVSDSIWFIEDFFSYQYGHNFNVNNRVHASILELYKKNKIELSSIRGLNEVTDRVKDKDKDKDKDIDRKGIIEKTNFENSPIFNIYSKSFTDVKKLFAVEEEYFTRWKSFIDFIIKNKFEKIFECRFVNPQEFQEIVIKNNFTEDIWEKVVKKILATGIEEKHNLYFRIPQFIEYLNEKKSIINEKKTSVGEKIIFD